MRDDHFKVPAVRSSQGYTQALERFERSLTLPIVPGELPQWLRDTLAACQDFGARLRQEVDESHKQLLARIVQQDSSLDRRVQLMKTEDCKLLERVDALKKRFEQLRTLAASSEPDEAACENEVSDLIALGLSFVLDVRKQDGALTTWLQEAFNRDRGIAD